MELTPLWPGAGQLLSWAERKSLGQKLWNLVPNLSRLNARSERLFYSFEHLPRINDLHRSHRHNATFCSKAQYYPNSAERSVHGGEKEKMNQDDAYSLARAILLIGGIVAIAFGATALGASLTGTNALSSILASPGPLLGVIVGVVALVASNRIKDEAIAIVMAVLGFLAGGLGGVLVAIGGIWAIISRYTIKAS